MKELLSQFSGGFGTLGALEVCMRLLCAMVVGLVIGTEREYTNRPAGMRTHILVALGSCAVMITGELIFLHYSALGATPDPARLGAQVITGVGFLGAGTILRDGSNVKGLTTAASLWAVACLGLAAGGGYYAVALLGMVFILVTLTVFEVLQNKLIGPAHDLTVFTVTTRDPVQTLNAVSDLARKHRAGIHDIFTEHREDDYQICFRAEIGGYGGKKRRQKFLTGLSAHPAVETVRAGEEAARV